MKKALKRLSILFLLVSLLAGCATNQASEKELNLKIGLMPAVDSAPIFLAQEKGYFEEEGLNVDIQVFNNAVNRQTALQAGELDGAMTDLISFINNINNGFDVKVVSSTDGSFPILANEGYEKKDVKKVGLMEISVSNYLTDEFIGDKYEIEKIFIPKIPARLEMVKKGKLDMAVIPEPLASMGELDGLKKLVFESKDGYTPDAMIFTGKAISEKQEAIKRFYKAYNKAVEDIAKDDSVAREVLINKLNLKPVIKDKIVLPDYKKARVPSKEYMEKVINWVEKVQEIEVKVSYEDMIERKLVE
ncbi:ABC transporter substrate-binding protein [Thermohalobacter berrensis]|uniref:NlpA lipoprotein n=1 Tax=Thermohalobacter berrensis TaxID=99594 RepID=A0A419T0X5_9FIRM|nr:MetQ/NlpA family ABC transporter substrate-binding protein [Thermohalobacter berrensis]RKD31230.1 NlpA lipoprotein [Thermohalobacter berrensis]